MDFIVIIGVILSILGLVMLVVASRKQRRAFTQEEERAEVLRAEINDLEMGKVLAASSLAQLRESGIEKINSELSYIKEIKINLMSQEMEIAKKEYEDQTERRQKEAQEAIAEILARIDEAREVQIGYEVGLQDMKQKYDATLYSYQMTEAEEKALSLETIQLTDAAKQDMAFLLKEVAPRLSNPTVLGKILWSEYVQKPMQQTLKRILPEGKEHSGIYCITYNPNKKCYIGKSVSVQNRLQDHVKSSLGVRTIADQKIHHAMTELGLWNFSFRLLEEVPKDQLSEREHYYINFFNSTKWGWNQVG